MHRHDVLILGSGLAALTTALKLADQRRVAIVTKREMTDGASDWAKPPKASPSMRRCAPVPDRP